MKAVINKDVKAQNGKKCKIAPQISVFSYFLVRVFEESYQKVEVQRPEQSCWLSHDLTDVNNRRKIAILSFSEE